MRIQVVGAGVCGLSCALRLREAGHRVRIRAAATTPQTTSAVAAALWLPFAVDRWSADTARWAHTSLAEFRALQGVAGAGVRSQTVIGRFPAIATGDWRELVGLRPVDRSHLPATLAAAFGDGACSFDVPVIDTRHFLPWLLQHFRNLAEPDDRAIDPRPVANLDEPFADGFELVVNCTGLGAAQVAPDAAVYAVEGQIVYQAQAGLELGVVDEVDVTEHRGARVFTYVVPRGDEVVGGGTLRPTATGGSEPAPDPELRALILERCHALLPQLRGAPVLGERAGRRPLRRGGPRVALERRVAGPVVHDYGHGGCGISLALGCARDVVALVERA